MSDTDQPQTTRGGGQSADGAQPSGPIAQIGRYNIIRERGRGAMGVVYEAVDPKIGRKVALKVLHQIPGASEAEVEEFRNRFFREARTAGMLSHSNIVVIHDVDSDEQTGITYMAMEFLKGEDVYDLLRKGVRFTREQAVDICIQVAEGLDHAHRQGVTHRDVKPANLMLLEDGTVKITDFGIAKISTSNLTRTGQFLGTPNYMSPEQVIGHVVDGRTDLFSLGIILYELLTGEKPFMGSSLTTITYQIVNVDPIEPSKIQPAIPKGYDQVCAKLLRKNPDERYQTGKEVSEALRGVRETLSSTAAPGSASASLAGASPSSASSTATGTREPTVVSTAAPPTPATRAAGASRGIDRRVLVGGLVAAALVGAGVVALMVASGNNEKKPEPPKIAAADPLTTPAGAGAAATTTPTGATGVGEAAVVPAPPVTPSGARAETAPPTPAPLASTTSDVPASAPTTTKAPARTPPRPPATIPARGPAVLPSEPGRPARLDLGSKSITGNEAQRTLEGRPTATVNFFLEHKLKTGGRLSVQVDKREVFSMGVEPSEKRRGRKASQGTFEVPDGRHVISVCLASEDIEDSPRCPYKEHSFVGNTTVTIRAEHSNPPMAPTKFSFSIQ